MLDDAMLVGRAADTIRTERLNAESALQRALEHISAFFDQAQDPYLRERKGDVADVVGRLTMNLREAGDPADLFRDLEGPLVLVAHDVTPSIIAQLDWQRLAGLVTDAGSWTNHTAILARSLRVPAVAGLHNASVLVTPGSVIAVDGTTGEVLVDPDAETLEQIEARQRRRQALRADARRVPRPPGHHRRRRGDQARGEHRGARRHGPRGRARRGRDRPVPIRIPARGRRARRR